VLFRSEMLREWNEMTLLGKASALFTGGVIFELFLIGWGWVCLETGVRGLGALRCLRVFRLLSYYELLANEKDGKKRKKPIEVVFLIMRRCATYLRKIGNELFTAASKGGTLLLGIFLYLTYLWAVIFWRDKEYLVTPERETCSSLVACFYTMMRLAFYDGTGLDFLEAVAEEQMVYNVTGGNNVTYTVSEDKPYSQSYSILLILYMIISAVILLNGLIGIFSNIFQEDEHATGDEILQDVQKILRDIDRVKMKMKRRVKEVDRGVSDIPIVPSGSPHPDA